MAEKADTLINAAIAVGSMAASGYGILEVAASQPKGWVRKELLVAAPSTLGKKAGRGVFATRNIPQNTVIGSFPGYHSSRDEWFYNRKKGVEEAAIRSQMYMWYTSTGIVIDPTDEDGYLPDEIPAFFGLYKVPTILALINEPGRGGDTNVRCEDQKNEVLLVAERNIYEGEELFTDYGPLYDRSHYSK